jgi:hypothetical protein
VALGDRFGGEQELVLGKALARHRRGRVAIRGGPSLSRPAAWRRLQGRPRCA